jgi:hypothetical protein
MRRLLLVTLLLTLGLPAAALAHGDGPKHYLEGVDVYPGFSPPPSSHVERQLTGLVQAANAAGVPLKVAVASEGDVLDRPRELRRPQAYAESVASFIGTRAAVIIVTPYGIGVTGARAPKVDVPLHASANLMAETAMDAVRDVAEAAGHPLPANVPLAPRPPALSAPEPVPAGADASRGWLPFAVFFGVFTAAGLLYETRLRLRRRRHSPSPQVMVTEGP